MVHFGSAILRLATVALLLILIQPGTTRAQCLWQPCVADHGQGGWLLARTTGHPQLDQRMWHEANRLLREFRVGPDLFIFNDLDGPNAYASPQMVAQGYPGAIFVGRNLLDLALSTRNMGDAAVALIMAHEWAHVLQGALGFPPGLPNRFREMHADLLAGWYLARRNITHPRRVPAVALRTYERGGRPPRNHASHGDPGARTAAMLFGYTRPHIPLEVVYGMGLEFLHWRQRGDGHAMAARDFRPIQALRPGGAFRAPPT